jgi:hypothetical protein
MVKVGSLVVTYDGLRRTARRGVPRGARLRGGASRDPDAVLGFFAEDAEVRLGAPLFRDRALYKGGREAQDFAWEHLAKDDVRVDPTMKRVAGEAVFEGGRQGRSPSPAAPGCRDERGGRRPSEKGRNSLTLGERPDERWPPRGK